MEGTNFARAAVRFRHAEAFMAEINSYCNALEAAAGSPAQVVAGKQFKLGASLSPAARPRLLSGIGAYQLCDRSAACPWRP